jgi:hypothetical protein
MSGKRASVRGELDAFRFLTDAMLTARPDEPIPAFGSVPSTPTPPPAVEPRSSSEERWQLDILLMTPAGERAGES